MVELQSIVRQRDITHTEAAALFGVSQRRVSNLMRGKINLFSLDYLLDMATVAGMDPIVTIAINKPKAARKPGDPPIQLRGISALDIDLAGIEGGHDPVAAGCLIDHFYAAFRRRELFAHSLGEDEKTLLRYIELAFGRYLEGKELPVAFGLERSRGRIAQLANEDRNLAIAAAVELEVRKDMCKLGLSKPREVIERFKNGKGRLISTVKMEPIYTAVGKKFKLSPKSIEPIFRDFETAVESLPDSVLALLAEHLTKSPK